MATEKRKRRTIRRRLLAAAFGLDEVASGIFFGATIHDVAQVVGAGYSVSAASGDTATIIKEITVSEFSFWTLQFMIHELGV